ncbi:hypothetical protein ACIRO3_12720 [Streptomyces sp. NPDC102278]|uniref:hypothetical protein n=1 Tax=Streptomyces sp. NPDC102278 TaxID=3366152 RepID=UPI00382144DA
MQTDRDERARVSAAEQRISEPLNLSAVADAVRWILARRPRGRVQERESLSCLTTRPTAPPR